MSEIVLWGFTLADIAKVAFVAGVAYAIFRQLRKDVDGIGKKQRETDGKAERRWKHSIATAIESAASLDEAKLLARLLREDAWKD